MKICPVRFGFIRHNSHIDEAVLANRFSLYNTYFVGIFPGFFFFELSVALITLYILCHFDLLLVIIPVPLNCNGYATQ
jgi:hypothetical protein